MPMGNQLAISRTRAIYIVSIYGSVTNVRLEASVRTIPAYGLLRRNSSQWYFTTSFLQLYSPNAPVNLVQTFIIIFADDFGFDINSFGSQTTSTPNLDKLASQVRRVNTTETSSGQLLPVVGHEADATLLRPFDLLSEQSGSWDWWSPCSASRLLWWSAREWNDYRGATEIEGICNDDDWKMASGTVEIVNDFSRLLMFLFSLSCGYWYRCFP